MISKVLNKETDTENKKAKKKTYIWTRHTLLPRRPCLSLWTLHLRKKTKMKLQISPVIAMNAFFSQLYALLRTTINGRITSPGEIGYFILKTVKQQSDSLKVQDGESDEV